MNENKEELISVKEIAKSLGAKEDSIRKIIRRHKNAIRAIKDIKTKQWRANLEEVKKIHLKTLNRCQDTFDDTRSFENEKDFLSVNQVMKDLGITSRQKVVFIFRYRLGIHRDDLKTYKNKIKKCVNTTQASSDNSKEQ